MYSFEFNAPTKIICERGAIAKTGALAAELGNKALICTGGGSLKRNGSLDIIINSLNENNIGYAVYEGIPSDPEIKDVDIGVSVCVEEKCDLLIAAGGGSVIDCAKAIGLAAANNCPVSELECLKPKHPMLPLIAIPTTAGTASEVTKMSIITDNAKKKKTVIATDKIIPSVAVLDVNTTLSMPPEVAAATGMDAFTHAIESYLSDKASVMTQMLALEAIRLISGNLHSSVYNNKNIEAREAMLLGQMYAGLGFSNTSTALVHSMSRPLGVYYGIPHGEANAVLLPAVMEYNMPACAHKMAEIAKAMGIDSVLKGDTDYAKALVVRLYEMLDTLPLRKRLGEMGVRLSDLEAMAESGYDAASTWVNPRKPTIDEMVEIYKKIM